MNDKLIYGKSELNHIVAIEPQDNYVEIFLEPSPGTIKITHLPNKYWVLSNSKLDNHFIRLKGNLHYKFGKQYTDRESFFIDRRKYKNSDIFSIYNSKEALQVKDGYCYFKDLAPKDISILAFDIETTGLFHDENAKLLLISNTYRAGDKVVKKLFAYDEYKSEKDFIDHWCDWVREMNPSILVGHNINGFDLPYLNFIAENSNTSLKLGRDNSDLKFDNFDSKFRVDGSRDLTYKRCHVYGREVIDTYFLSIKYDVASKKYESYGLKNIIKQEGLEKKDRTFYDSSQIRNNYKNQEEWLKIKEYCNDDADDALSLYDLFSPPFFYMAQSIPKPWQLITESAPGSQINALLMRSYLQEGHSLPRATEVYPYSGGISLGVPGVYKNVKKIDISSLYPSIMLQYEVFDKDKDPSANFLKSLQYFTTERLKHKRLYKETKNKYHDDMSGAYKILINSYYGFLGASGLLFNSCSQAEFVTKQGRNILEKSIEWATGKKYESPTQ